MNTLYITPTTYFVMNSNTLSLYVNSTLVQTWVPNIISDDSGNLVKDDSNNQVTED